jgi:hypothetical protein
VPLASCPPPPPPACPEGPEEPPPQPTANTANTAEIPNPAVILVTKRVSYVGECRLDCTPAIGKCVAELKQDGAGEDGARAQNGFSVMSAESSRSRAPRWCARPW